MGDWINVKAKDVITILEKQKQAFHGEITQMRNTDV